MSRSARSTRKALSEERDPPEASSEAEFVHVKYTRMRLYQMRLPPIIDAPYCLSRMVDRTVNAIQRGVQLCKSLKLSQRLRRSSSVLVTASSSGTSPPSAGTMLLVLYLLIFVK